MFNIRNLEIIKEKNLKPCKENNEEIRIKEKLSMPTDYHCSLRKIYLVVRRRCRRSWTAHAHRHARQTVNSNCSPIYTYNQFKLSGNEPIPHLLMIVDENSRNAYTRRYVVCNPTIPILTLLLSFFYYDNNESHNNINWNLKSLYLPVLKIYFKSFCISKSSRAWCTRVPQSEEKTLSKTMGCV